MKESERSLETTLSFEIFIATKAQRHKVLKIHCLL